MKPTAFLVIFALALFSTAAGWSKTVPSAPSSSPPLQFKWQKLANGLSFSRFTAERYCRMGDAHIAAVLFDPREYRLVPFHYREDGVRPRTIEQWREKTGAVAMFNAGQYRENLNYMGLFWKNGRNLGSTPIKIWKALLVYGPRMAFEPMARIVDLKYESYDLNNPTHFHAVQSLMLLDARGEKRVRKSDWIANHTVVGETLDNKLLVFCTEGGYTLWDLAELLRTERKALNLKHAMVLDGGYQAELAVKTKDFNYVTYGQWVVDDYGNRSVPGIRLPLPAVIGVMSP